MTTQDPWYRFATTQRAIAMEAVFTASILDGMTARQASVALRALEVDAHASRVSTLETQTLLTMAQDLARTLADLPRGHIATRPLATLANQAATGMVA